MIVSAISSHAAATAVSVFVSLFRLISAALICPTGRLRDYNSSCKVDLGLKEKVKCMKLTLLTTHHWVLISSQKRTSKLGPLFPHSRGIIADAEESAAAGDVNVALSVIQGQSEKGRGKRGKRMRKSLETEAILEIILILPFFFEIFPLSIHASILFSFTLSLLLFPSGVSDGELAARCENERATPKPRNHATGPPAARCLVQQSDHRVLPLKRNKKL